MGRSLIIAARWGVLCLLAVYQRLISPWLGNCCRFYPSCSQYCADAVRRFGVVKGLGLGMARLCRCHPFHAGGFDPVPARFCLGGRGGMPFLTKEQSSL